jgi:hypothetical protein
VDWTPYKRRCDAPQVFRDVIDPAGWNALWGLLKDPERLLSMGEAYYNKLGRADSAGSAQLEVERTRLENSIVTTQQMMQDGLMALMPRARRRYAPIRSGSRRSHKNS